MYDRFNNLFKKVQKYIKIIFKNNNYNLILSHTNAETY